MLVTELERRPQEDADSDLAGGEPSLAVINLFLKRFEAHAIRYCYWKRSAGLPGAMAGIKDFDLLVDREDQHQARTLLMQSGFKAFANAHGCDHPAIESYLGFDEPSGRIVHVHLHLRLVIGEHLSKVYRLPWEATLLRRVVRHRSYPVWVLDASAELLVTIVRASIELTMWDPIALRRWSMARQDMRRDLAALAADADAADVTELAENVLGRQAADAIAAVLAKGLSLERCAALRRDMMPAVDMYSLYAPLEARVRSCSRSVRWALGRLDKHRLHRPRPWGRRVPGGGCVVAIVGLDGSGKSSAVQALKTWLSDEVDVVPVYFGTGEGRPSLVLLPFKLLVPIAERIFKRKPRGSSHGAVTTHLPGPMYSIFLTIWATVVALEKRLKLTSARRAANRGMLALADRYPQNEIDSFNDGPLLPRLPTAPRLLRDFERAAYVRAQQTPPDLVLKLVVTADTAARREPTMDRAVIAERVVQLRALTFGRARVVAINAEQPHDAVIRDLKREVWAIL